MLRYENINWTTGDASGGSNGLGGSPARAGYSAGDGVHYFELPQSGNQGEMLALPETAGNTGIDGLDVFQVHNGNVQPSILTTSGQIIFTDPDDGDVHSISNVAFTGPGQALGTLSLVKDSDTDNPSHTGEFTWTYSVAPASLAFLAAGETRTETFNVTISDGHGGTAVQTVTVTDTGTNQVPVAQNSAISSNEKATITGQAQATVVNGDALTYSLVNSGGDAAHGSVVMHADGSFSYTPDAGFAGTDQFTFIASDGSLNSNAATVTVTVFPIAPVAQNGTASGNEDGSAITGQAVATDVNASDPLSYSLVGSGGGAAHGSVVMHADGSFSYTPDHGFFGTDTFTYQATDTVNHTVSNSATVTVSVAPVAPVAQNGTASGNEDGSAITGQAMATDVNTSDALSYSLVGSGGGASHGSVVMHADGSFSYTPDHGFFGTDSFTYQTTDTLNHTVSNAATVTVSVAPVAPVAQNGTASGNEDGSAITGQAVATDVNASDPLSYSLVGSGGGASHGSVVMHADGTFTYTPDAGYVGSDSFTYTASDATNGTVSNSATVTVSVAPVAPVAQNGTASGNEDGSAITGQAVATDVNASDPLSYSLVGSGGGAAHGSVAMHADGSFSYTPDHGFFGTDSFTYQTTDTVNHTVSNSATVTVSVAPVAPVAQNGTASGNEDGSAITGQAMATDVNTSDPLSYSLVGSGGGAEHGSVVMHADGTFTYTPDAGYVGSDSFTYTASDATNGTVSNTATETVTVAAAAPVAQDGSAGGNEDDNAISGQAVASQINGDPLTYILAGSGGGAEHGSVVMHADGTFTYTPDTGYVGPDSFTYTASDATNGTVSNTATETVTVAAVAPVAQDGSAGGNEDDNAISGQAVASQINGDPLSYTLTGSGGGAAHGSVVMHADGTFTYTPDAGYVGSDSFTYTASDATNGTVSNTATETVTVAAAAPVARDGSAGGNEDDNAISGQAVASQINGDPLSYTLTGSGGGAEHGSVVMHADGTFTYTPDTGYVGSDSFTYTASDATNGTVSNTATETVTVAAAAPVARDGSAGGNEDDNAISGQAVASQINGDPLTYSLAGSGGGAEHGSVVMHADGTFTYTPAAGYVGSDSFTYTASDATNGTVSNTATETVTVAAVAPTVSIDNHALSVDAGGSVALGIGETPFDSQDTIAITITGVPSDATLSAGSENDDGSWTLTPDQLNGLTLNAGAAMQATLTVTATNTEGQTASAFDSIALTVVNPGISFNDGTINFYQFNGFTGYSGPQITNGGASLTLTDGGLDEAGSWFNNTVSLARFTASFDYQANGDGDGIAFILQNDPSGTGALEQDSAHNGGSGLGYSGISPSAAVEFNIYNGHTQGTNFATNGATGNYNSTSDVAFWNGDEIHVDLSYDGSVLTETLTDLANGATFTASYSVDLQQIVGTSTAYVGFSGASGGATATQTVSNFFFNGAAGVTFHWTNSSGGDWTDAGSWDLGAVPQASDHAIIDALGNYAVTTNADETIATLALSADATLNVGAGTTFTIAHATAIDTNAGAISIGDGGTLAFGGTLANLGSITLGSSGESTVAGDGPALLDNSGFMSGAGELGNGQLSLINEANGVINATGGENQLIFDTGAGTFTNAGLTEATGIAGLTIESAVNNTGTLQTDASQLIALASVTGGGSAVINGGMLEFGATRMRIPRSKSAGTLKLLTPESYTGTITGFDTGDILDLAGFTANATATYNSGTLTVADDSHSVSYTLVGDYSQDAFAVTSVNEPDGSTDIDVFMLRPPEANSEELAVNENSQLTAPLPASQVNGDPLVYGLANSGAGPSSGSVAFNTDGTFTYTPNEGFTGSDSFQYAATDTIDGISSTGAINIDVNASSGGSGPVFDNSPQITQISVPASPPHTDATNAIGPSISADGDFVVFTGTAQLPSGQDDGQVGADIYLYNRLDGTITDLSALVPNAPAGETYNGLASISLNGDFVVFSGEQTVSDGNGGTSTQSDTYLYDRFTGHVTLLPDLQGSEPAISGGGNIVAKSAFPADQAGGASTTCWSRISTAE